MDKIAASHSAVAPVGNTAAAQRSGSTNTTSTANSSVGEETVVEEETAISLPDDGEHSEGGNLKMIVQLVKKCLGVKDIAAMRLSLPASLLEPIPNLEYWQYLDRPDLFAAINDSEDEFNRMLAVLRFTFSKDLKFIRGKVCKPYNSVLGEHFRSHWEITPATYPSTSSGTADCAQAPILHQYVSSSSSPNANNTQHLTASSTPSLPSPSAFVGSAYSTLKAKTNLRLPQHPLSFSGLSAPSLAHASGGHNKSDSIASSIGPGPGPGAGAGTALSDLNLDAQMSDLSLTGGRASSIADSSVSGMSGVSIVASTVATSVESGPAPTAVLGASVVGSTSTTPSNDTANTTTTNDKIRIAFLTEQISHHPPISSFHVSCPARHLSLSGIDQISAKVSGTSVRVSPGSFNKGLFVRIEGGHGDGERYRITHPVASVNGILRGSFYVTVGESTVVTCEGFRELDAGKEKKGRERLRAVIEYKEESWLGKPQFAIEGVIHTYKEGSTGHEEWTKIKHVPKTCVVAHLEGSWRTQIRWRRVGPGFSSHSSHKHLLPHLPHSHSHSSKSSSSSSSSPSTTTTSSSTSTSTHDPTTPTPLLDLTHLNIIPKRVRPLNKQLPNESRKLWENVTSGLVGREYGEATRYKQGIEQRQRERAAERKRRGEEFVPVYFEKNIDSGEPVLTAEGRRAIQEELEGETYEESVPVGI